MTAIRVVFIHGVATSHQVWRRVVPHFAEYDVRCPQRPASGDLETELAALREICDGAVVVGVSGGATLGMELASRGVPIRAGVFHEPAVGSLAPGLLDHVAAGLRSGGVAGFGRALYGPVWNLGEAATEDRAVVAREFAMFSTFEPSPMSKEAGPVLLTVGAQSPAARLASVQALSAYLGRPWASVPDAAHAVHLESPAEFSSVVLNHIREHVR